MTEVIEEVQTESEARFQAVITLEGGYQETFVVTKFDVGIAEDGTIGSYDMKTVPEENYSFIYFRPSSIIAIRVYPLEN